VVRHFCGVPNVIEQMTTRLSLPTVPHETVQGCALTVTGWINDRLRTYEPSSLAMSAVQRASEEPTVCTASKTDGENSVMSASLIGRLGSSAFRPSTTAVSVSLAGSRFSTESAHRPFHDGIRGQGGAI